MQPTTPEQTKVKLEAYKKTPEGGIFDRTRISLGKLIDNVRSGKDVPASKKTAAELLSARDRYYRDLVGILNPQVEIEEHEGHTYKVKGMDVYGSLPVLLDATPQLATHRKVIESVALKPGSSVATVEAEEVQPRSLFESHIGFGGSMAEARINKFPTDVDLVEYIRITPPEGKSSEDILAAQIQASIKPVVQSDINGKPVSIYYEHLRLNPLTDMTHPEQNTWSVSEIQKGEKIYRAQDGTAKTISLSYALRESGYMLTSYQCLTDDSVFHTTKKMLVDEVKDGEVKKLARGYDYGALNELFFQDPTEFGLVDKTYNVDTLIQYLGTMEREVTKHLNPQNMDVIKAMKRFYNWNKAMGDLAMAEEVAPFFSTGMAYAYQLSQRLDQIHYAKKLGIDVRKQEGKMKNLLIKLFAQAKHPLAHSIVEDLTLYDGTNYRGIHEDIMKFVNMAGVAFIKDHPNVRTSMKAIQDRSPRGNYGSQSH